MSPAVRRYGRPCKCAVMKCGGLVVSCGRRETRDGESVRGSVNVGGDGVLRDMVIVELDDDKGETDRGVCCGTCCGLDEAREI